MYGTLLGYAGQGILSGRWGGKAGESGAGGRGTSRACCSAAAGDRRTGELLGFRRTGETLQIFLRGGPQVVRWLKNRVCIRTFEYLNHLTASAFAKTPYPESFPFTLSRKVPTTRTLSPPAWPRARLLRPAPQLGGVRGGAVAGRGARQLPVAAGWSVRRGRFCWEGGAPTGGETAAAGSAGAASSGNRPAAARCRRRLARGG